MPNAVAERPVHLCPSQLICLWGLRIYGPASNAELSQRMKIAKRVHSDALGNMVRHGFAEHVSAGLYDVTDAGREFLAACEDNEQRESEGQETMFEAFEKGCGR